MMDDAPKSEASCDHHIVDWGAAEAVGFLVHIKNAIENPKRMLLGL